MGVRAIVVNKKKKKHNTTWESIWGSETKRLLDAALLFEQTHHFKPCVPLSSGFP